MASNYYYFIASLPELSLEDKILLYTETGFRNEVREFLPIGEFDILKCLYYPYDIKNFINLIKHDADAFDERGNLSPEELSAGKLVPETLPTFMEDFVHDTQPRWETAGYHELRNNLTERFIDWTSGLSNGFLNGWFGFEHNLRNILAGLNSRKFARNIEQEILGSHFEAEKLRSNKDTDFGLGKVVDYTEKVLGYFQESDIAVREASFDQLRWEYIEDLEAGHYFDLENIMAYSLKIRLIERNLTNTHEKGQEQLEALLRTIRSGHELPETTE